MTLTAPSLDVPRASTTSRRIAQLRAVAALLWAIALAVLASDAGADLGLGVAALVAAYPLIDVTASLQEAALGGDRARLLRVNAAISALATVFRAAAAIGADAGAVLAVFGVWAVVSGALQLANAIRRRRTGTREVPMIVSGAVSTLAGISFIASSGADDPTLTGLAAYAAVGALLYLLWAHRTRTAA